MAAQCERQHLSTVKLLEYSSEISSNPLHLSIRSEDKANFFNFEEEDTFVLSIAKRPEQFWQGSGLCLCVSVKSLDPEAELSAQCTDHVSSADQRANTDAGKSELHEADEDIIPLLCSAKFFSHYDITRGERLYAKCIHPPLLTKVTFEASTARAFNWASSHCFTTGLLVTVCNQNKVLVRRGDLLLSPHSALFENDPVYDPSIFAELTSVDTEPFLQGIVSLKTEFIVLNSADRLPKQVPQVKHERPAVDSHQLTPILVSDFAVPRTSVFLPRHVNRPTLNTKDLQEVTLQRDWSILPCCSLSNTVKSSHPKKLNLEFDHVLYVSLQTAKRHSFFNGSVLDVQSELKPEHRIPCCIEQNGSIIAEGSNGNINSDGQRAPAQQPRKSNLSRVVQVQILSENGYPLVSDDLFLVPTALWYNLNGGCTGSPLMTHHQIKFRKHQPPKEYIASCSASIQGQVPYAREVHISCVYSPDYSSGASFAQSLKNYFTTTRLLQSGDIFAVDTKDDFELLQNSEGDSTLKPLVYFKVKKILPKLGPKHQTYRVDQQHSALFQEGSCHSYAPTCLKLRVTNLAQRPETPPGLNQYIQDLSELLQPYLSKWQSSPDVTPSVLLHGSPGSGKSSIVKAVANASNMHYFQVNCHELCGDASSATEARIQQSVQRACMYAPCILHMHNIHALGKDRDGNTEDPRVTSYFHQCIQNVPHEDSPDWPVIVMATTSTMKHLTADMHSGFLYTFEVLVPDEQQREEILTALMEDVPCSKTISVRRVAQRTAGFVLGDLQMLISRVKKLAYNRIMENSFPRGVPATPEEEESICMCGPLIQQSDFDQALDHIQSAHSDAIGAPKIPSVTWNDVGGLAKVKADILDTIQLPLEHPELFAAGLRRSGVLLFGPPGTGKTLLAKAVATECSLNFLSVKGPELINMYVGQSEENVREVFNRARNATPCVIFFDELDSLAPNRGRSGDSGGVMDRVVSQLLAELDGMHKSCDVFVIGATNRPDLLDPALLRPGRFDKLLYLGVSEDRESQLKILKALTRKFSLESTCKLERVVERCPYNMTGADFYALGSDAMLNALKRSIDLLEAGRSADEEKVEVTEADFYQALDHLVPSVSETELQHYKTLQRVLATQK